VWNLSIPAVPVHIAKRFAGVACGQRGWIFANAKVVCAD
jgi:hypothetical protein